jgi:hypothetical protein
MNSMWQRSIEEQGFAILPDIVTPGEIDALLEETLREAPQRRKAGIRHILGTARV